MRPSRPRPVLSLLAPALLVASLAACNTPPKLPPGADNPGLADHGVTQANPLDVAVMKVDNQTGRSGLPLTDLRREFTLALVERHYSPLSLEYVDGMATEASYSPGASQENALLQITLTGWDDHLWRSHSRLVIDADVWLLDAAHPTPDRAFWGGHVHRTMDMSRLREVVSGDGPLMQRTVSEFARDVMASLPARRPELASAR